MVVNDNRYVIFLIKKILERLVQTIDVIDNPNKPG